MSYTKLKTNDYRLKSEINNSVNFLMPHCFFGLHLTCGLVFGMNFQRHLPNSHYTQKHLMKRYSDKCVFAG